MAVDSDQTFFSVIIPTRNRPELFELALKSVLEQSFAGKQVIVVNDGSTSPYLEKYKELEEKYSEVEFHYLIHRPKGHGQSYSMNFGFSKSVGRYICFLDDDDYWTDALYLEKVYRNLAESSTSADLHYCHQKAYFSDGTLQTKNVWVEDLIPIVGKLKRITDEAYLADVEFMLESKGFAHLNCSVFSRDLYSAIDGMDEGIRYECDRDIYLRSIDRAETILFATFYNSRHNIPDPQKKDNMSTLISDFEKKMYQLRVYEKGILLSTKLPVIKFCLTAKSYELKNVAEILAGNGDYPKASYYARESLLNKFNFKWLAYTLYLSCQSLIQKFS